MPRAADNPPAIVLGGGIAGLAAARLLTRHYARVVVLERDTRPEAAEPESAFGAWQRRGVPQFRHSHAFLARLRLVLLAHLPEVLDRLRVLGVRELGLAALAPPGVTLAPEEGDDEVVLLACRRATFEWVLRECERARPGIELHEGVSVAGLSVAARDGRRPSVTGVRLADGSVMRAALVVDATGRRSRAPAWLAASGAPLPLELSADTGTFYYTRFYRRGHGRAPRGTTGLVAGDLGWVKVAIFPGDNASFSISVGAPVADGSRRGPPDARRGPIPEGDRSAGVARPRRRAGVRLVLRPGLAAREPRRPRHLPGAHAHLQHAGAAGAAVHRPGPPRAFVAGPGAGAARRRAAPAVPGGGARCGAVAARPGRGAGVKGMSRRRILPLAVLGLATVAAAPDRSLGQPLLGEYAILGQARTALRAGVRVTSGAVGTVGGTLVLGNQVRVSDAVAADTIRLGPDTRADRFFHRFEVLL